MRSVTTAAMMSAWTILATCPAGMVLGSVIMKKTKNSSSGDVTTTHQNDGPQTGATDHRAVMQWPDADSKPRARRRDRART